MSTIEKCHFRLYATKSDQILMIVCSLLIIASAFFNYEIILPALLMPVLTLVDLSPKSYQKSFRENFQRLSPEKQKRLEQQFVPPERADEKPHWYFLDDGIIEFNVAQRRRNLDLALYEDIFIIERLENDIILNMRATARRHRYRFSFRLEPGEEIPPILLEKTGCYVMKAELPLSNW